MRQPQDNRHEFTCQTPRKAVYVSRHTDSMLSDDHSLSRLSAFLLGEASTACNPIHFHGHLRLTSKLHFLRSFQQLLSMACLTLMMYLSLVGFVAS